MGYLTTIRDYILDTIFPVYCLACHKNGENLCRECISSFSPAERESAKWIYPTFDYREPAIKKAVWLLKYKGKKSIACVFAKVLYGHILEELSDLQTMENFIEPILVPIPINRKRKRERGFNQSELICKELVKLDLTAQAGKNANFKMRTDILEKIKDTGHQARVENRSVRLKNILGSFALKKPEVNLHGKNMILIDDVTTTGATLTEARKILREAGARKVIAFTIAH